MLPRPSAVLLVLLVLALPGRAGAAVIGTFGWDYDPLFTGSTFSVTNESTGLFEDVQIDLFAPGAGTSFQTLLLGDIAAGTAAGQFEDLSLLLVPDDLNRAVLTLLYNSMTVTAELLAASLDGDPAFLLGGATPITAEETETPVPEPSTLMLLMGGATGLLVRRSRRRTDRS